MALKIGYEDQHGVTHPNAYWRVVLTAFDRVACKAEVAVVCYHDQVTRDDNKLPFPTPFRFNLDDTENEGKILPGFTAVINDLDSGEVSFTGKMYQLLKMLPEFANAENV